MEAILKEFNKSKSQNKELEVKLKWRDNYLFSDKNLQNLSNLGEVSESQDNFVDLFQSKKSLRARVDTNSKKVSYVVKNPPSSYQWRDWDAVVSFTTEEPTSPFKSYDLVRIKKTKHFLLKDKSITVSIDVSDVYEIQQQGNVEGDVYDHVRSFYHEDRPRRELEIEYVNGNVEKMKDISMKIMKAIIGSEVNISIHDRNGILQTLNELMFGKSTQYVELKPNQPLPMTIKEVQSGVLKTPYAVTLKYDGLRKLLFGVSYNGNIYFGFIVPSVNVIAVIPERKFKNFYPFIVDGELIEHKNKKIYCIFDLIMYGDNLTRNPLYDSENENSRLIWLKDLFSYLSKYSSYVYPKENPRTISGIEGLNLTLVKKKYTLTFPYDHNEMSTYVENAYNDEVQLPEEENPVRFEDDGLIFTPIYGNYMETVYKWKPLEKLTIDLAIMEDGSLGVQKGSSVVPFRGSKKHPLQVVKKPVKGEYKVGRIGEFKYERREFNLMRWRDEKTSPNSIITAESNWDAINEPLDLDTLVGKSTLFMKNYHQKIKKDLISYIQTKGISSLYYFGKDDELLKQSQMDILQGSISEKVRACLSFNIHTIDRNLFQNLDNILDSKHTCYFAFICIDRKNLLRKLKNNVFKIEKGGETLFEVSRKDDKINVSGEESYLFNTEEFIFMLNDRYKFNLTPEIDETLNSNKNNFFQGDKLTDVEKSISEIYRLVVLKREIIPFYQDISIKNLYILSPQECSYFDKICGFDFYRIGVYSDNSSFFHSLCQVFYSSFRDMKNEEKIDFIKNLRGELSEMLNDVSIGKYYNYLTEEQIEKVCEKLEVNVIIVNSYTMKKNKIITNKKNPTCLLLSIQQHFEILGIFNKNETCSVIINPDDKELIKIMNC